MPNTTGLLWFLFLLTAREDNCHGVIRISRGKTRPTTAVTTNRSSCRRVPGNQIRWSLAPFKPVKMAPFYPGANTQHRACEGIGNSRSIDVVVNSLTTTKKVQKVGVGGDWSLGNLGINTSGQLFEDEHEFSTIILYYFQFASTFPAGQPGSASGSAGYPPLGETPSTHRELAQKLDELEQQYEGHDAHIQEIFEAIRRLTEQPVTTRR